MACISLPTAALLAGGLGAAGSVASAVIGGNAASSAAKTQAGAAKTAADATMTMYNSNKTLLQPFQTAGVNALGGVSDLLGEGTGGTAGILAKLQQMPGYQFQLGQGLQATQNGYAAQGLGQSGAALKGAANYAEGLAGTTYQSLFGNQLAAAGLGENAAGALAGVGANATSQANQYSTSGAAATAAGTIGAANALNGGIGGATGALGNSALLMALQGSGMFGAGSPGSGGISASTYDPSVWGSIIG